MNDDKIYTEADLEEVFQRGYDEGAMSAEDEYTHGYDSGYWDGHSDGYDEGYDAGFNDAA